MKKENDIWHDAPGQNHGTQPPMERRRWNRWLDHFFSMEVPDYMEAHTFAPPYEILETESYYLMCLDLPGISATEVKVEVYGSELVISGERVSQSAPGGRMPFRARRRFGRFRRTFSLPSFAAEEGIEANCWNGVLEIVIPKRAQQKHYTVAVTALPEFTTVLLNRVPLIGREEPSLDDVESQPLARELELGQVPRPSNDKAA